MSADNLMFPQGDRLVRLPELQRITGRSRSALYSDPNFPKPIKLTSDGRASGWILSEVMAWMADRVRASRAP